VAKDVLAPVTGKVWKIEKKPGDSVSPGDSVLILESMKMEVPVEAPSAGRVISIKVAEGEPVEEGAVLAVIE
jgi:acetyl-CoA carboxylase biotin carboxyl carrier protein